MKHCGKSPEPPACLADFRQQHPHASWDEFRDDRECYTSVRDRLSTEQGGVCAYCELDLLPDNRQVAHFHPKSDQTSQHNWGLDWNNLWLACKGGTQRHHRDPANFLPPINQNRSCDESKGDKIVDDVVLSPAEIPPFPRIFDYDDADKKMTIIPNQQGCEMAGIPVEKVKATIEIFKLNCDRLAEERWRYYDVMVQAMKYSGPKSVEDYKKFKAAILKKFIAMDEGRQWKKFFTLTRWYFEEDAEKYLRSIAFIK